MAPAKSASIAAGPALNVFQSIFTPGPRALSKKPLAFPTIAWECVMLGNAPTRIVFAVRCPQTGRQTRRHIVSHRITLIASCLFTLRSPPNHGKNTGG